MKKHIFCLFSVLVLLTFVFSACPTGTEGTGGDNSSNDNDNNNNGKDSDGDTDGTGGDKNTVKTGKVNFFNESSYTVVVHQDAFSGPVLETIPAGQTKKVDVRTSDNYGVGSTFSIEYLYRITDGFDTESGEVIASGIDPGVQINFVVEEDKTYTKQIPQPAKLEFRTAFIKILNAHSLPFELRYLGTAFKQTGNGNLSVAPGKTGVYKLEGIPTDGKEYQNYTVNGNFESTAIPGFTAQNGSIYKFTFNGTSVTKIGEETIVFK